MENKNKFYKNFKQKFGIDSKQVLPKYLHYSDAVSSKYIHPVPYFPNHFGKWRERHKKCYTEEWEKNADISSYKLNAFQNDNIQQFSWEKTMEQNNLWKATLMPFLSPSSSTVPTWNIVTKL